MIAILLVPYPGTAQPVTKQEILKRGKTATAFVIAGPSGSGTAFCVSPNGLWITNEHVARHAAADGKVQLVLNSNLATQKTLTARIVRRDAAKDLALLQSEGSDMLPTLPLGDSEKLEELATLYAFGFPFGNQLSLNKKDFPAVSVNTGSVSSLRRRDGKLETIEMELGLNPGNSGGPVLDENGNVIGLIQAGVSGAKLSRAIPATIVRQFLQAPVVEFNVLLVRREKLGEPVRFEAKITSFDPDQAPLKVGVIVDVGGKAGDSQPMKLENGVYRAEIVPLPPQKGPIPLQARVRFSANHLDGEVKDQEFRANNKQYFLHDVKSIVGGAKPVITLSDATTLEGLPLELQQLTVVVDEESFLINLAKIKEVTIVGRDPTPDVTVSIVVHRGTQEVARVSRSLVVVEVPTGKVAATSGGIQPPTISDAAVTRTLPGDVADVAVGGGGRFLALHIPRVNKVGIFDINEAKVIRYLDAPGAEVMIAAGLDHLLIALPSAEKIQKWSLKTLELESTVAWTFPGKLHVFAMGSGSSGPVMWVTTKEKSFTGSVGLIDPKTMKPIKALQKNGEEFRYTWHPQSPPIIRVSADGRVFGAWASASSPSGIEVLTWDGTTLSQSREHDTAGFIIPGPDGTRVYTGKGLYTPQAKPIGTKREYRYNDVSGFIFPACHGEWSFQYEPGDRLEDGKVRIFLPDVKESLGTLSAVQVITATEAIAFRRPNESGLYLEQRVFMIPAAKSLVAIPIKGDRLHVYRLDPIELMEKSGVDYLAIVSQPPSVAVLGQKFTYAIDARSRKGGLKYELASGPEGMTISTAGIITWAVPSTFPDGGATTVIVSVRDKSGQERTHTFSLRVLR